MKNKIKNEVLSHLEGRLRGSVSFLPKQISHREKVSEELGKTLESIVSTCMQASYQNHVTQKTSESILTITHDVIYIDASQKGDFDIFTYITKVYFNQLPEEIRIQYNKIILGTFDAKDKSIIGDIQIEQIGGTDVLFEKEIEIYKSTEVRQKHGSDIIISREPMNRISILMRMNNTKDINIFLDNISNISQEEKKCINTLIRGGLLMGSESWAGLFINNGTGKRDYGIVAGNHPPQDGHDMTLVYL